MDIRNAAAASRLVTDLVAALNANRAYLSEIDGAIGDGDHGINMSKGFTAAGERLAASPAPRLSAALATLGETLVEGVGGSMGPLYGNFFLAMAEALGERELVDAAAFVRHARGRGWPPSRRLGAPRWATRPCSTALVPARDAFAAAVKAGKPLAAALDEMTAVAERGRDSTKDMVARVGRASRLGERSRGVLDAGATSCALILATMAKITAGAGGGMTPHPTRPRCAWDPACPGSWSGTRLRSVQGMSTNVKGAPMSEMMIAVRNYAPRDFRIEKIPARPPARARRSSASTLPASAAATASTSSARRRSGTPG